MKTDLTEFIPVLTQIKSEFEHCIRTATFNSKTYTNGNKAKEAFIRSQRLIGYIHEFIKQLLVQNQVNASKIYPPINKSKPEINLEGFLKAKNQDICVIPDPLNENNSSLLKGRSGFRGAIRLKDDCLLEKSLVINARSQLSSLDKNFDTLYERTFAEPLNLHLKAPKLCIGEVYLIPTHEYDDRAMVNNRIDFRSVSKLEKYIKAFQAVNNRIDSTKDLYKYERVWLIIADFRQSPPRLHYDINSLIDENLLPVNTDVNLEKLTINDFVTDLLDIYSQRFDSQNLC